MSWEALLAIGVQLIEFARQLSAADGMSPDEFDAAVRDENARLIATARAQFEAERAILDGSKNA